MGMIQVPFGRNGAVVSRIEPLQSPDHYKTYDMSMPVSTHWRKATCEEVGCANYQNGWDTILPAGSDKADLVRSLKGRYHFTEFPAEGGLVKFRFPPQPCFEQSRHRVPLERPARFTVARGDFRGYFSTPRVHRRAEDWVEDFAIHSDKIRTAQERRG